MGKINSQPKKILDFLRRNAPHSYNVKTIHKFFKDIPENSIKVVLHRLLKQRKIFEESKGFYSAYIDLSLLNQLENPPTTLHGIMLECKTINKLQKNIEGIPSKEYTEDAIKLLDALDFIPSTNYRYNRVLWYDGRRITITVHLKGKINIFINSSKNPLIYLDFLKILSFLEGFLNSLTPINERKVVQLLEVGVAKDYRQLRLDGVKSVTLHSFTNVWSRIYYKDEKTGTRFEHHIDARMNLDDALKSLSILTNPINLRYESKSEDSENPAYG